MTSHLPAAAVVAQDKRRRRRLRRRLLTSAGLVAALVLFGFFGLPPILRAQAVKHLSAALHREVSIEKIRLNPFFFSVTVEGLQIKDRDGGPFSAWKRLHVDFDSFSLFTGEWRFQEVSLDGFSQRVAIGRDGAFNFADLIPPPSAKPAGPAPSKPRPIRIDSLSITAAAFAFADASRLQPFSTDVGPLSFKLTNFVTAGDPQAPYEFSAMTEAGETFAWKGTVGVDPVRSAGEFRVGRIAMKKYAPYYADRINADVLDGVLDVTARYAIDLGEGSRQLALTEAVVMLSRLQLAARGGTTPLIDLPSLRIDGLSADLLKPSASIRLVALDGGHLKVVRAKDGSINLLDLLVPSAPAQASAPAGSVASSATAFPDVKLAEFALSGLAIDFEDRTTPAPARNGLGRLDVSLKNISLSEAASPIALKLFAATLPGGRIDLEGTAVLAPLSADLAVKIASLPLSGTTPYIEPLLNIKIAGGSVSVDAKARLSGGVAGFRGDVVVDQFATVDGARGEDFVSFTQFALRGIDAVSAPLTAKVAEIALTDPAARVIVNPDKTTNLNTILRTTPKPEPAAGAESPAPVPAAPAAPAAPAPVWSLGKFTLVNGSVTFHDRSIKPAARIAFDRFNGTITGLSSADLQRGDVDIAGKLNGTGRIAFTGKLDARAATPAPGALTEITVDVKGADLSPISPYMGFYAGYELARGGLAVDVKASLARRQLDTANVVTLNQFTLGAPTNSPGATKLPVRLGVALLKDIDGNIVIDLPVKGSLDDPDFRIGRVVLRVVVNLLAKAATSPFSLIGSMFGGGGDELAYQDFAPGAATPLETELKKIETLRKALKGRPALSLDITGGYDAAADLAAVRERTLDLQVRYRLWEELRAANPATPPPDQLTVPAEDEKRIIGLFIAERYPAGLAPIAADGTVNIPPPLIAVMGPTPVKTAVKKPAAEERTGPYVRGSLPVIRPKPRPPVRPVVIAPAPGGTAPAPGAATALTLADARRALAAAIPVSDDDLRQLAESRAQAVRDALLAGGEIDAGRVFLAPSASEGKGARVFLQLR